MGEKRIRVVIGKEGTTRYIHDDKAVKLLKGLGEIQTRRASHVEPFGNLSAEAQAKVPAEVQSDPDLPLYWFADLSPVQGPVLGPFTEKQDALSAEVAWLLDHDIPTPSAPTP